jgi:protein-histidine pros-kinase
MGLKAKFNLTMLAAFVAGLGLAAAFSYTVVREDARDEVLQNARLMMTEAIAIRDYTSKEIEPLLADQSKIQFLPHTVPAWAAQTNFRLVQERMPDYAYKEPTLNPTNPADRPTDWQADLIAAFQQNPALKELVTERDTPTGRALSLSRPFRLTEKDCLECHSTPGAAPASMVSLYGTANGFGWKLGDVQGVQVVTVPESVALRKADRTFLLFLGGLTFVFAVMLALLNVLLQQMVVRRVRAISRTAEEVSLGNMDAAELPAAGRDEIASLAQSFNRMRRSLANAMRMLEAD